MSVTEWAAVIGGGVTVLAATYSVLKIMMRGVLLELQPNGGSSMKDKVDCIEHRVDALYELLVTRSDTPKNTPKP